jgi:hypothetical protein
MAELPGAHESLRKEGAETPPDVSYRFVVSFGTCQAASAAWQAATRKKTRWARTRAFLVRHIGRLILGLLLL